MAVIFKAYMNMLDDTFDTKKEIEDYIKNGLKEIVEAKKAEGKAKKAAKPKPEPKKKAAKAAKSDDEDKEEKAKKDAIKAEEKAKKAEEKAAEKAKKEALKAEEKAKKTDDEEDSDDSEPKKPVKKAKKEAKAAEIDEEGNVVVKPKKPPTERKIFYDEMRIKVKDMFPDLNSQQTTKKIAELWKVKLARLAEANKDAMNASGEASS